MAAGIKVENYYSQSLGKLYSQTPKAVFAAIAVSALTIAGDRLDEANPRIIREWWSLYRAGIVPQRPPAPDPGDEYLIGNSPDDLIWDDESEDYVTIAELRARNG